MHITRFRLNPRRRGAVKLLSSPHAMHAAVLAGFPEPGGDDRGRVLWRLDAAGPRALLYVVSPMPPDLTHLVEQAGWPSLPDAWETRSYQPLLDRLRTGQRYRFRLTANPVHRVSAEGRSRSKTFGHVTVEQQEGWLLQRQEQHGFDLGDSATVQVVERRTVTFRRGSDSVTLRVATFDGELTVADPLRLGHALAHGIGRAKGYGCGLMTLAPLG